MRKCILFVAVIAGFAFHAVAGQCAPKRTLRIVTVGEIPGQPDASPAPVTLYRLGIDHGRIEEPDNPSDGTHMLIVMNGQDMWMANLRDMTGRHVFDDEPPSIMHAPVLDAIDSKLWKQFEYGCEEPFMKAVHARAEAAEDGGTNYTFAAEGTTVTLRMRRGTPERVDVTTPEMQYRIRYLAYETVAEPAAGLFEKPKGVSRRHKVTRGKAARPERRRGGRVLVESASQQRKGVSRAFFPRRRLHGYRFALHRRRAHGPADRSRLRR